MSKKSSRGIKVKKFLFIFERHEGIFYPLGDFYDTNYGDIVRAKHNPDPDLFIELNFDWEEEQVYY